MNQAKFHHAAIIVSDLDAAVAIYEHVLGLQPDERPDLKFPGAFYQLGGGQQLHLMQLDNPDAQSLRPSHGGRYRHLAFSVPDLSVVQHKLEAAGIDCTPSRSGRAALFFYDADGNGIEVLQQN
ncbi:MAG: hypothetical protein AUK35_09045 [Zetaproteobacteria bacterium CG2_30_46_52]|nr:MAG: hypothetical protein AUK35_09045 [Zetaproteobacteria bacterium CG2_30_46_52]